MRRVTPFRVVNTPTLITLFRVHFWGSLTSMSSSHYIWVTPRDHFYPHRWSLDFIRWNWCWVVQSLWKLKYFETFAASHSDWSRDIGKVTDIWLPSINPAWGLGYSLYNDKFLLFLLWFLATTQRPHIGFHRLLAGLIKLIYLMDGKVLWIRMESHTISSKYIPGVSKKKYGVAN